MSAGRLSTTFPSSSAIDCATYDPDARTLDIWYAGGDRYSYSGVPRATYEALCAADSAGEFVNREVKPRFPYEIEPSRRRFRPKD